MKILLPLPPTNFDIITCMFTKEWYRKNTHPKGMSGKKHSVETKLKMSQRSPHFNLGRKMSDDTKNKISISTIKRFTDTKERQKLSDKLKGFKHTNESKKKMSIFHKNNPNKGNFSKGHFPINAFPEGHKLTVGEKSGTWKGGVTSLKLRLRKTKVYINWRKSVFTRDKYTCVICKKTGDYLEADHIVPFAYLFEKFNIKDYEGAIDTNELWDTKNGRTLCKKCHSQTNTFGVLGKKYKETLCS